MAALHGLAPGSECIRGTTFEGGIADQSQVVCSENRRLTLGFLIKFKVGGMLSARVKILGGVLPVLPVLPVLVR